MRRRIWSWVLAQKVKKKNIGISISCDGVCLTLINIKSKLMEFYLSNETIKRSKFKKIKLQLKVMSFSRLRMWLFFGNLLDYLIISTFSHTGMIIDGNVLVKLGIKPFFPMCQFLECLRLVFEGVNHDHPASFCGRVEGGERATSRSRKWARYVCLLLRLFTGQRSHDYSSAKTDKRTSCNDFNSFLICQNHGSLKVPVFDREKRLR